MRSDIRGRTPAEQGHVKVALLSLLRSAHRVRARTARRRTEALRGVPRRAVGWPEVRLPATDDFDMTLPAESGRG